MTQPKTATEHAIMATMNKGLDKVAPVRPVAYLTIAQADTCRTILKSKPPEELRDRWSHNGRWNTCWEMFKTRRTTPAYFMADAEMIRAVLNAIRRLGQPTMAQLGVGRIAQGVLGINDYWKAHNNKPKTAADHSLYGQFVAYSERSRRPYDPLQGDFFHHFTQWGFYSSGPTTPVRSSDP